MTGISTHVLDTSLGRPAAGVPVELALHTEGGWQVLGTSATDSDGRVKDLPAAEAGSVVRLLFDTAAYYAGSAERPFFPRSRSSSRSRPRSTTTTCRCCSTRSATRSTAEAR